MLPILQWQSWGNHPPLHSHWKTFTICWIKPPKAKPFPFFHSPPTRLILFTAGETNLTYSPDTNKWTLLACFATIASFCCAVYIPVLLLKSQFLLRKSPCFPRNPKSYCINPHFFLEIPNVTASNPHFFPRNHLFYRLKSAFLMSEICPRGTAPCFGWSPVALGRRVASRRRPGSFAAPDGHPEVWIWNGGKKWWINGNMGLYIYNYIYMGLYIYIYIWIIYWINYGLWINYGYNVINILSMVISGS